MEEKESPVQMVNQVTCSTGKKVLLRDMKIRDKNLAVKAARNLAGSDDLLIVQSFVQDEILKLLIVAINGTKVPAHQKEDLDSILTLQEYCEVMKIVSQISGDTSIAPKLEQVKNTGI